MRVEGAGNRRARQGAGTVARPAPRRAGASDAFADPSGVVDLAALMGGQPNGLEEALASVKASGRASRLYDSRLHVELAPIDVTAWTSSATTRETTRAPRRRLWPAVLDVAVAGLLVAAYVLAPREVCASLVANASRAVAVVAAEWRPAPPAPSPLPSSPPRVPPPIDAPPVVVAMRVLTVPVDREAPAGRRGRQAARPSPVLASVSRTRAPKASPAPREAAIVATPPSAKPTNALDSAIREAAGPAVASAPAPNAVPAVAAPTSTTAADTTRPDRPSGSAVASAITQVLPAARACLGDVPDASRATISFGPDGAVQKVEVTGPAAASAKVMPCLRSALGRAHVPPFAQSSYAASVTVRPL